MDGFKTFHWLFRGCKIAVYVVFDLFNRFEKATFNTDMKYTRPH